MNVNTSEMFLMIKITTESLSKNSVFCNDPKTIEKKNTLKILGIPKIIFFLVMSNQ